MSILRRFQRAALHLAVSNGSDDEIEIALEPFGDTLSLEPGETREITYRGDLRLGIHSGSPGRIELSAEGRGVFEPR